MGRMVFNIIPRDGKRGEWLGEMASYDHSDTGRYEMYITDYADNVCEGETQTAKRAWCEDASAVLNMFTDTKEFGLSIACTLGHLQRTMSLHIADMDAFTEICDCLEVKYEILPLLIERHDLY